MKKLSYIFAGAALMTAAAVSCTKEAVVDDGNGKPVLSGNTLVLKASHEDGLTKTSLVDGGTVTWAAGDRLGLVYTGGTIASAELGAEDAGQAAADFTFDLGDATVSGGYVVYPGSTAAAYDGSALTVTVPSVQDGTFAGAAIEVAAFDGEGISGLKNLGGLLQIKVESEVSEILISSNDGTALAGTAAVTFSDGIPGIESVSDASTAITLKVSGAGTYYAAVLPATIKAGLYIEMKSGEEVVGEKMSGSSLSVARKQIRNLGTIATGTYDNKLFVKTDGTGDGSTWDTALNYAGLISHLKQNTTTGKNIYVAAGTYQSTETSITNTNFKIFGGYPADATGTSLSGRDIEHNETIFDGGKENRIFVINSSSVNTVIDGCIFQNATNASNAGSALVLEKVSSAKFVNCAIKDNTNTKASSAGGAVRAGAGTITFTGCTFSGNTAANGGAISVQNTSSVVTITDCTFSGNEVSGDGGAIRQTDGSLKISSCTFTENKAAVTASTSSNGGSAIHTTSATLDLKDVVFYKNTAVGPSSVYGSGTLYINSNVNATLSGCRFEDNTVGSRGGAIRVVAATSTVFMDNCVCYNNKAYNYASAIHLSAGTLAMNNCTVYLNKNTNTAENDGASAGAVYVSGKALIANSTLRGQSSYSIIRGSSTGNATLVNSIIVNATIGKTAILVGDCAMTSYGHNIYSVLSDANEKYVVNDSESHPDYVEKLAQTWSDSKYILTKSSLSDQVKNGLVKSPTSRILDAITAFDGGENGAFATWLNGGYLVDALGTIRNTSGCWPGAYEGK